MSTTDPFAANRAMWDETAPVHAKVKLDALLQAAARPDFNIFDPVDLAIFDQLGLEGRSVFQLCCNNARELVCAKRAGAGRCVGFDFSAAFLEQGAQIARAAGVDVELVNTNVFEIPDHYFGQADIVYVTVGALGWLPDAARFFSVVASLLRPGGHLFLYDMHPALFLYDEESDSPQDPHVVRSYFQQEPLVVENVPDYFDPTAIIRSPSYWFQHTLGEIFSEVLRAGLTLEAFEEYPHDVSGSYQAFQNPERSLPMSYSLVASKSRQKEG
jgi:SAM-dependent methyltransferase